MNAILDCESYEQALLSLAAIYGASDTRIVDFLTSSDLTTELEHRPIPEDDVISNLQLIFEEEFGEPKQKVAKVCWFHLTRALRGSTFSEGILPLVPALEKIWPTLISIVKGPEKKSRLEKFRTGGVPDHLYREKISNTVHHGPHAFLFRESAFNATARGNHNYLGMPEIVRDICNGYENKYGESISEEIRAGLTPYIVKFVESLPPEVNCVELACALDYCRCKALNDENQTYGDRFYIGDGKTITSNRILKVESL